MLPNLSKLSNVTGDVYEDSYRRDIFENELLSGIRSISRQNALILLKQRYPDGPKAANGQAGQWKDTAYKYRGCCNLEFYRDAPAWVLDDGSGRAFLENGIEVQSFPEGSRSIACIVFTSVFALLLVAGILVPTIIAFNGRSS